MPPKKDLVDDLIAALSDKRVTEALANVIELKLQPLLQSVSALQEENKQMANKNDNN